MIQHNKVTQTIPWQYLTLPRNKSNTKYSNSGISQMLFNGIFAVCRSCVHENLQNSECLRQKKAPSMLHNNLITWSPNYFCLLEVQLPYWTAGLQENKNKYRKYRSTSQHLLAKSTEEMCPFQWVWEESRIKWCHLVYLVFYHWNSELWKPQVLNKKLKRW